MKMHTQVASEKVDHVMAQCEVCGNQYDKTFEMLMDLLHSWER